MTTEINGLPQPPLGYRYAKPGDKRYEGLKIWYRDQAQWATAVVSSYSLDPVCIYAIPLNDGYDYFEAGTTVIQAGDEIKYETGDWFDPDYVSNGRTNNYPLRRPNPLPWADQIAEGHNNSKLTNAQVGEGYRLLNVGDEIPHNAEVYASGEGPWKTPSSPPRWVSASNVPFRVPTTKPRKTVPLEAEDWKGIWWIRQGDVIRLVTAVTPYRIWTCNLDYSHKGIADFGYERSRDGINWELCSKEVDA